MGEMLTKKYLSKLYDETAARAKKIGGILGMQEREIQYLHSQLLFDELRKIPVEEFDKLILTKNNK